MAINADWHRAHPMPKKPTIEQRIAWAIAHAEVCDCRDIPPKLRAEMAARGIVPPPRPGDEHGGACASIAGLLGARHPRKPDLPDDWLPSMAA
jgi:hypothetical protein